MIFGWTSLRFRCQRHMCQGIGEGGPTGLGLDVAASSSKKFTCPVRVESDKSLAVSLAIDAVWPEIWLGEAGQLLKMASLSSTKSDSSFTAR